MQQSFKQSHEEKPYLRPQCKVRHVELHPFMGDSISNGTGTAPGSGSPSEGSGTGNDMPWGGNSRRGTWGDLWSDGRE